MTVGRIGTLLAPFQSLESVVGLQLLPKTEGRGGGVDQRVANGCRTGECRTFPAVLLRTVLELHQRHMEDA